ncbi:MAG TPA: class I SAM-dependent methyltransferase [Bryobacteraceae bacterium]|nr:class I SAM-dependent methyltransferase [Bryobacteraceae bacterium]
MALTRCNLCGGRTFTRSAPVTSIEREIRLRDEFVHSRLGRKASRSELKDLTDFMHGFPSPLVACSGCGILTRSERRVREAHSYEEDPNDPDLMAHVYPRYLTAFRNKKPAFAPMLRPHASVLELGSHLGAFLQAAEEWNWRAVGLDVGKDTSAFVASRGLEVQRAIVEDCEFSGNRFDAVFVWNCFEQLPDPIPTLLAIHRQLKRFGLLVIRVPNALFYTVLSHSLAGAAEDGFVMRALAYNNLLGFPYLYGYTAHSLNRLLARCGYEPVRAFNSELVTMPFADVSQRIFAEQTGISDAVAAWSSTTTLECGTLTGPWIELVYRKLEEPVHPAQLPRRKIDLRFLERAS